MEQEPRPRRAARYAGQSAASGARRTQEYIPPRHPQGFMQPQRPSAPQGRTGAQRTYAPQMQTAYPYPQQTPAGYPTRQAASAPQGNAGFSPLTPRPQQGAYAPQAQSAYQPGKQRAVQPQAFYPAEQAFPQRKARVHAQPERAVPTPAARLGREDDARPVYRAEDEPQPRARSRAGRRSAQAPEETREARPGYRAEAVPQPVARSHAGRGSVEDWTEDEARRASRLDRTPSRMPRWLTLLLSLSLLLCMALLAAHAMMSAYITRQTEAREAAYQQILDRHPLDYRDYIERYASEYNLQPSYVAAIILNESNFNPSAVSNVGARGLMQLMEDTAEWINGKLNVSGYSFQMMYDPETNIRFGCWYLNYLSKMFGGDPVCVTSAYHAGQGTVNNWIQSGKLKPFGGNEAIETMPEGPTKTYAGRVTRAYGIYDALYYHAYNGAADGAASASGAPAGGG